VKIRVKGSNDEYTVSKTLICKESSYFAAMFKSEFSEGQTQTVDMEEIKDVVSSQSLASLIQLLYHRRVRFSSTNPGEKLTAAIELARLADMCDIKQLEDEIANLIEKILVATPKPDSTSYKFDMNSYWITGKHVNSAAFLPKGHAVRRILAAASVEGYLKKKEYKFVRVARDHASFGADLLEEVRQTLSSLKVVRNNLLGATVEDPITGQNFYLNTNH
jgi:energy-converting hydrogenase A subunit M